MLKRTVFLETGIRNQWFLLKGILLKIYLRAHQCKAGANLKCKSWPFFRCPPSRNMVLGDSVTIGHNITFEPCNAGKIIIGDYVNLTHNIVISSSSKVSIGDYTLIGENTSIRDSDHNTSRDNKIIFQKVVSQSIHIGSDCWIGAGCVILKGSNISDGCVIGANSVVTRHSETVVNRIYAGSPIQQIGERS